MDTTILDAELIERAALLDLHRAAGRAVRAAIDLRLERDGTMVVESARPDAGPLLNRCIGLGLKEPATREQVIRVLAHFASAGVSRYYVHVVPDPRPPELRDWLKACGLAPYRRSWVKFTRGTEPPPSVRSDLKIERIDRRGAEPFGRIVAAAFDMPPGAGPYLAGLVGRSGWHAYLSRDSGGSPAGAGAMFVRDRVAWLSYAATLPDFRGRGGQGAILAQRIRDALELGARLMVTETGEALENEPQHSFRNIERAGFRRAYVRENWSLVDRKLP